MSRAALSRVARLGDGWLALAAVETWDPERLRAGLGELRAVWAATGRAGRPRAVLELHCADGTAELLRPFSATAAHLGSDEVAVELPWRFGIDAAAALTAELTGPAD